MSIVKSGSVTVFNGLLQRSLPIVLSYFVSIFSGEVAFAHFTFLLVTANTISAVCALGIAPAIMTSLAITLQNNSEDFHKEVVHISMFVILLGIVSFAGCVLLMRLTDLIPLNMDIWMLGKLTTGLLLIQATQAILYACGRFRSVSGFVFTQVILVSVVSFYSLTGDNPDNLPRYYSSCMLFLGMALVLLVLVSSLINNFKYFFDFGFKVIGEILSKQLPFTGYTLVWMISIYGCVSIVAREYSVSELAIFNLGYQWYSLMLIIPALLGYVFIPLFVKNDNDNNPRIIIKILCLYSLICVVFTACTYFGLNIILELYNFEITMINRTIFLFLIGAACFTVISTPLMQSFIARRNYKILYAMSGLWCVIGLIASALIAKSAVEVSQWFFAACVAVFIVAVAAYLFGNQDREENHEQLS